MVCYEHRSRGVVLVVIFFFFQAEDGIRDMGVTGVQTCALPISLCIGEVEGGYAVSSETCGLDIIGARFLREVAPGEVAVIDDHGLHSYRGESPRSEGGRVGKECRSRWSPYHLKKKTSHDDMHTT